MLDVSPQRVRGWISGYAGTKADPILDNEIGWVQDRLAMSFTNLMEVRFIATFSRIGVKVTAIREMLAEAKAWLNHPHPFATDAIFKTDGRKIFAQSAEKTDDKVLYDLKAKNWAMHGIIAKSLIDDVLFDPNGDAKAWRPRRHETPSVIIYAAVAFGQPVLKSSRIPTRALFNSFLAEGETEQSVARWFGVSTDDVREAVKFETLLKRAA